MACSREFELVVQCCAAGFDRGRIAELPTRLLSCDFGEVVRLARRHRVEALVWDALSLASIQILQPHLDHLRIQSLHRQAQNLQSTAAIADFARASEAAGLDFLLVKGLATGHLAYCNPIARTGRDIDILVAHNEVDEAASLLFELGFTPTLPVKDHLRWHATHKESVWSHENGLIIELHSALADSAQLIPHIGMHSDRQSLDIGGAAIETLGPSTLIAYTCVHGASSMWFRSKWITDLAALLWKRHGSQPADASYAEAISKGAGRAAGLGFLLANRLFATPISADLENDLARDAIVSHLVSSSLRLMNKGEPTARPFGTAAIRANQLLLMPTIATAFGEAGRQVREIVSNQIS